MGLLLKPGAVVTLDGSLGAGKTTFAKGIGEALGIQEPIKSPTFTILSVYEGTMILNHFDLYRISHVEELETLGFTEPLYSGGITLIEWSDRADELPDDRIAVTLHIEPDYSRTITIRGPGE